MSNEANVTAGAAAPARPDYASDIVQLIRSNVSPGILREKLEDYHENDLAAALMLLTAAERQKLWRILEADMLSGILEYADDSSPYLAEMGVRKAAAVLSLLEPDTAVSALRSLDRERREAILEQMDAEARRDVALVASFDEEEIGSRMTTNYVLVQDSLTVKQAMRALIRQAADNDNISTIYVEDADHVFCGAVDLKDLITARDYTPFRELIVTSYPYLYGRELIADCVEKLKEYSEDSIPILDNDNRLLGVITSQEIVEVVEEEMGEDYAKFAGLSAAEDLTEPILRSIRKRLPWLVILLGLGLMVSAVVGFFEQVVSRLTIIMTFQSMILGMSGNVGTQSLAVTIRVLADESLTLRQKIHLVSKEMRLGLCNGVVLGLLSFVAIGLYILFLKGRTPLFSFAVSGCIGLALLLSMIISGLSGTLIPLLFKKLNIDPAVASGPLISTLNDLVAVVSYYGLSWLLLIQVLHLG